MLINFEKSKLRKITINMDIFEDLFKDEISNLKKHAKVNHILDKLEHMLRRKKKLRSFARKKT